MRIDLSAPAVLNESLSSYLRDDPDYNLKDIEPYNQADMYMLHCDMLIKFANIEDQSPQVPKHNKRQKKQKQKAANMLITEKLQQMRQDINQLEKMDTQLTNIKQEQKNLMGQLFSERVSLTIAN
jgi:small-conductance mechanosensitive channel